MLRSTLRSPCRARHRVRFGLPLALALALVVPFAGRAGAETTTTDELRVGIGARPGPHSILTPLVYWGGFVTKTACFDGLSEFGERGEPLPGLAARCDVTDGGRHFVLHLRPGVTAHDGSVLVAQDVVDHLQRWRGNPANAWIGSTQRLQTIRALDEARIEVLLTEPWIFLEECAGAINPAYVVAPGAYDHEGTFRTSVGTGPFRFVRHRPDEGGDTFEYEAHDAWWGGRAGVSRLVLKALPNVPSFTGDAISALRRGELDLVTDGSSPRLDRALVAKLASDPELVVHRGPGSATTCAVLNSASGPFRDLAVRRRFAAAIDRDGLVAAVEHGFGRPARSMFAVPASGWPESDPPTAVSPTASSDAPIELRLLLGSGVEARAEAYAAALTSQVAKHGFVLRVVRAASRDELRALQASGSYDLVLRDTYGVPYDPWVTLQTWFFDRPPGRTASSGAAAWSDARMRELLNAAFGATSPDLRRQGLEAAHAHLAEQTVVLPLVVPQQVIISRRGIEGVRADANAYDLNLETIRVVAPIVRPASVTTSSAPASAPTGPAIATTPPNANPRADAVRLPAASDWDAWLVQDNRGVGIWTVASFQVFDHLGAAEVIGLDDAGRMHVNWSYSGKWTPIDTVNDGQWLGGLAHDDLDPRVPGKEIYTAGARGNLYQVTVPPRGRALDARRIASIEGREINILVAGDFDLVRPGRELLGFTGPGGLFVFTPTGKDGTFEVAHAGDTRGLVRDAVALPVTGGISPTVATVARDGRLSLLTMRDGQATWTHLAEATSGRGRIAARPGLTADGPWVLYSSLDDGRVERHEQPSRDASWRTELIYAGPAGPRGVAAGRFHEDPTVESIAVFGYARKVQLLERRPGGSWTVTTIFRDIDKGHWLAAAEVDARNGTDELLASGFGGRIVMLSRPPAYGLGGVAVDPEGDR